GYGPQHAAIRKFWQPRLDRFVEPYLAFLHQNHCRTCSNGLRNRSDAKDRVTPHWRRMADRQCAERLHMNVVMMTDERNEPRHLFTLDVSRQHLMHALKPQLRKTFHAHVQL